MYLAVRMKRKYQFDNLKSVALNPANVVEGMCRGKLKYDVDLFFLITDMCLDFVKIATRKEYLKVNGCHVNKNMCF